LIKEERAMYTVSRKARAREGETASSHFAALEQIGREHERQIQTRY
jgi:hypothetical protein